MESSFLSQSEDETFRFARDLAASLTPPTHILLFGELGAGKTTFTKGLAAGFGLEDTDDVSSPTFTLVNRYRGRFPIYHIDLYRLDSSELGDLGLEEIFDDAHAGVVVEWAERLGEATPPGAIRIALTYIGGRERRIEVAFPDASKMKKR